MSKNDQGSKQLPLDFSRDGGTRQIAGLDDRHAVRRPLLSVVVANTTIASSSDNANAGPSRRDMYSREVTATLQAYVNRLGW